MRRLIRFEDETGEPQSLLVCALLLLFAIRGRWAAAGAASFEP